MSAVLIPEWACSHDSWMPKNSMHALFAVNEFVPDLQEQDLDLDTAIKNFMW